jgi:hypothetical protein
LQVGKSKIGLAVAAISGSEQRKQRLILVDGQELSIALSPTFRREIETEEPDLS